MPAFFHLDRYLERINFQGQPTVDLDCLGALHRHHVMSIPFEATDIHFGQRISLEPGHIYDKVINRRRGGFCYELNYLFHTLLRRIGFKSSIIAAVVNNDGHYGAPFDHMSIVVELDGPWLLDVGFGDLSFKPIRIQPGNIQSGRDNDFLLEETGPDAFMLLAAKPGSKDFTPKYRFDLRPRSLEDFAEECRLKQNAPESYFVRNFVCTLPTEDGRKTIWNGTFKVRRGTETTEQSIEGDAELRELLAQHFGLE